MSRKADKRPAWAGDCETDPFQHGRIPEPFIWGLDTGVSYHEFDTADAFADYVRELDVIVYFHNGGKFDFHLGLIKHLNPLEKITVINGRLVVGHIGKCEIRDSWNLLPVPLAAYAKDTFDYTLLERSERNKPGVMLKIRQYLRSDCRNLYNLVHEFEDKYGRHLTIAGASMKTWVSMSGREKPKTDREYFQIFSRFYYGGRVQCFERGRIDGPCYVKDINSAYPWAMLTCHPYSPDHVVVSGPKTFNHTSMVTIDCVSNGALPYRDDRGAMTFPDDGEKRRYFVPGHEILAAQETGSLSRVELVECIDFTDLVDFSAYILRFYNERLDAKSRGLVGLDLFCKLFMNNLYGKFAANPDNYGNFMLVPFAEMEAYMCDGYEFDGLAGPYALLRAPLDDWQCEFINVATAASITSQVRAKLWRAISSVNRPIYCDTDSIICAGSDLPEGDALGEWKHEGTADTVWIAGKKMYLCDGITDKAGRPKMACKGVRLTPQQLRRAATGETVTAQSDAPTFRLRGDPYFQTRNIRATA